MEQMKVADEALVTYDCEAAGVPQPVKEFTPVIFTERDAYCVLLGPDPQVGVFGCGCTVDEAVSDWLEHYKDAAARPGNDEVGQYIADTIATKKENFW